MKPNFLARVVTFVGRNKHPISWFLIDKESYQTVREAAEAAGDDIPAITDDPAKKITGNIFLNEDASCTIQVREGKDIEIPQATVFVDGLILDKDYEDEDFVLNEDNDQVYVKDQPGRVTEFLEDDWIALTQGYLVSELHYYEKGANAPKEMTEAVLLNLNDTYLPDEVRGAVKLLMPQELMDAITVVYGEDGAIDVQVSEDAGFTLEIDENGFLVLKSDRELLSGVDVQLDDDGYLVIVEEEG